MQEFKEYEIIKPYKANNGAELSYSAIVYYFKN